MNKFSLAAVAATMIFSVGFLLSTGTQAAQIAPHPYACQKSGCLEWNKHCVVRGKYGKCAYWRSHCAKWKKHPAR